MTLFPSDIATSLSSIVGVEHLTLLSKLSGAKQDQILAALQPSVYDPVVVYPRDQAELAAVVTRAHEQQWRLLICGHRSKLSWGQPAADIDVVISTQWLNRVIDHAAGDLTVTVEAGVPLAALQTILAAENQFVALDPAYADHATIGGIIATQDSGSLRHRYGGVRDMVLGVTFVRADGQITKAGGRVVKNVAGYDLMKLLTGSFGTLGIMTQVTLRLYPKPEQGATLLFCGNTAEIEATSRTLINSTLTPTAVELLTPQFLAPYDLEGEVGLAVRFQGLPESVEAQCLLLAQQSLIPSVTQQGDQDTTFWQTFQSQFWLEAPVICKVGVLPAKIVSVLQRMKESAQEEAVDLQGQFHAGSGLGLLRLEGETTAKLIETLRTHCQHEQGFLTVLEAPSELKTQIDVWGYQGNALESMRKLKEQFDPLALLNPGRFVKKL
ncbi:MAG: FAD-binding oxidoreductase [Thermosynechococcaceae cyanobacterium]